MAVMIFSHIESAGRLPVVDASADAHAKSSEQRTIRGQIYALRPSSRARQDAGLCGCLVAYKRPPRPLLPLAALHLRGLNCNHVELTFALIGAGGAAAGAAVTAALYSTRRDNFPHTPAVTTTTTTTVTGSTRVAPIPSAPTGLAVHAPAVAAAARRAVVDPNGLFQYGFPGPVNDLRPAASLTSSYDRRTRNPAWVAEHITPESLANNNADRKHSVFVEDVSIPEMFRAKLKDYLRSGYDRGHQVPAADAKWSQEAMDDTFALSNMCPQVGNGFNRDYWAHFEDFCRRTHAELSFCAHCNRPLVSPQARRGRQMACLIRSHRLAAQRCRPHAFLQSHFCRRRQARRQGRTGSVCAAQRSHLQQQALSDFEVPIEAVERASGLEFATKLSPDRRKKLCQEVNCGLIVKQYAQRQKVSRQAITES
ncbi:hypothetical protein J3E74DRAFT_479230 [Bipolaris maydis]|nr:hypothetical protein J3E74DRAFT_479230 [Bipolaris maydis]